MCLKDDGRSSAGTVTREVTSLTSPPSRSLEGQPVVVSRSATSTSAATPPPTSAPSLVSDLMVRRCFVLTVLDQISAGNRNCILPQNEVTGWSRPKVHQWAESCHSKTSSIWTRNARTPLSFAVVCKLTMGEWTFRDDQSWKVKLANNSI